jgi:DNA-directed RNA polymerase I, II, and III subunit RPABC1
MIDDLPNDAKSKEVVRLWRAWRTVHEMVADRVRFSLSQHFFRDCC